MSEKSMFERMSAGEWYGEKPDAELSRAFWRAKDLAWEFNQMRPSNRDHGAEILLSLFGHLGKHSTVLLLFMWIMAVISRLEMDAL